MLTLPRIIERKAQHFIAVRRQVRMPFNAEVGPALGALFGAVGQHHIRTTGPVFMKYNVVAMPELEIDFAVPVAEPVAAGAGLVAGALPAGRYAETTWFGHYDQLMDVNAVLIGWADQCDHRFDVVTDDAGDHFAARLEIYHNDPDDEPDPGRWQTTVLIKLQD